MGGARHARCSSRASPAALVGTRALLGEGWDCPPLNVLVDLTVATTGVSVQQMRGRSLRLDPGDPQKVASNWDVVCVAPDLVRGSADYERFVRKHLHLFAPAEDGEIEAGPVARAPGARPVRAAAGRALQRAQRASCSPAPADRDGARERWQIGTPYRGVELPTLLVRAGAGRPAPRPTRRSARGRTPSSPSACRSACGLGGAARSAVARRRRRRAAAARRRRARAARRSAGPRSASGGAKKRLPLVLPLDAAARAVVDAYRELGELSAAAAGR